ncbi:importin subunit alpha-7-like protein [Leptotrombidium deliense]|uniref:Importin subunit alpha n=1 Tax=Leptotrombidium deliense TaxID=299467 RepID=A0A443STU6_9ACAR|nr:importin subunit alpha-7-like protein [Leptotrombidium deliense]
MEASASISSNNNEYQCVNLQNSEDPWNLEEAAKKIAALQIEDEKVLSITEDMIVSVMHSDPEEQLNGTRKFRRLLSSQEPHIDEIIKLGMVPIFVGFLKTENPKLQSEAAWVLTNIANGNVDQTRVIIEASAVRELVKLLYSPNEELQEICIWALANIAGTNETFRNFVHFSGIMIPLLNLLSKTSKMSIIKTGVWALRNLCRGKNPQPELMKITPVVRALAKLLHHNDPEVIVDICFAISYVCECGDDYIQTVIDSGVGRRFIDLLSHHSADVVYSVLRAVGHIFIATNVNVGCLLDCIALIALRHLLFANNAIIRRTTCWALSNVTAGDKSQLQRVIDTAIFPRIIEIILSQSTDTKERHDALWVIRNAIFASNFQQTKYLVGIGLMAALCECLSISQIENFKTINLALNSLSKVLEIGTENLHSMIDMNSLVSVLKPKLDYLTISGALNRNEEFILIQEYLNNYQRC